MNHTSEMYETVRGFRVKLECTTRDDDYNKGQTYHETIIVLLDGIETECEAVNAALDAARNCYPNSRIVWTEVDGPARWCPTGGWADESHRCILASE